MSNNNNYLHNIFDPRIDEDWDTLEGEAWEMTRGYLQESFNDLDDEMGVGYAAKHPEIVAGVMQTMAVNFQSRLLVKTLQEGFFLINGKMDAALLTLATIVQILNRAAGKPEDGQ
jgi:hypothetical protein